MHICRSNSIKTQIKKFKKRAVREKLNLTFLGFFQEATEFFLLADSYSFGEDELIENEQAKGVVNLSVTFAFGKAFCQILTR